MQLVAGTDLATRSLEHVVAHTRGTTHSATGERRREKVSYHPGPQGGTPRARAAEPRSMHRQDFGGTREREKVFQTEGVACVKAQRNEYAWGFIWGKWQEGPQEMRPGRDKADLGGASELEDRSPVRWQRT